jgi:ferric iron reductase protein FhuF
MLTHAYLEALFTPHRPKMGVYSRFLRVLPPSPDEGEVVPASFFLDKVNLRASLQALQEQLGTADPKIAASIWSERYMIAVLPVPLRLMAISGVGVNSAIPNVNLVLEDGMPRTSFLADLSGTVVYPPRCANEALVAKISQTVPTLTELHQMVFTKLFGEHLELILAELHALTRISKKVLWGNLGYFTFSAYHLLNKLLGMSIGWQEDYPVVQNPQSLIWQAQEHSFYGAASLEQLDDPLLPEPVVVRHTCCLVYQIPDKPKCVNCPLCKPTERIERLKALNTAQAQG